MLSRLRWFLAGAIAGVLAAVYALFRLRQARNRFVDPDQVIETVGATMQSVGRTLRHAWDESREAIEEAEGELRTAYVDARPHLRDVSG